MGNDPILAWAREARESPALVISDLESLSDAQRQRLLVTVVHGYTHEPYLRYKPNLQDAIHQEIANEYIAPNPKDDRRWKTFYLSKNTNANQFHLQYQAVWDQVDHVGEDAFFSQPEMMTYLLQTVTRRLDDISALVPAPLLHVTAMTRSKPHQMTLDIPAVGKMPIFMCSAMELLPEAQEIISTKMQWMVSQGYHVPGALMIKADPGGSRQTDQPPCPGLPQWKGSHLRIGAVPERMPCTIQHEDMHEIRSQLPAAVLAHVEIIYNNAMTADRGLIFNDEYFMKKFLHAGHPMQDSNEFFASAAHAYTEHADELHALIQNPKTPPEVRDYATAMWNLLRDEVFHGKEFAKN